MIPHHLCGLLTVFLALSASADEGFAERAREPLEEIIRYGSGTLREAGVEISQVRNVRNRLKSCISYASSQKEPGYVIQLRREIDEIRTRISEEEQRLRRQKSGDLYSEERMAQLWRYHEQNKQQNRKQIGRLEEEMAPLVADHRRALTWWAANRSNCEVHLVEFKAILRKIEDSVGRRK